MASTVLMPTVRNSVLLPDMFEPLTSSTRVAPEMSTSLHTRTAAGINGWPKSTAWKDAAPAVNSGNGSPGCS